MVRRPGAALITSFLAAAMGCGSDSGSDAPEPPVSVSPVEPGPEDAVTVRALTLYGEGKRGDGSNYHFHLTGPTGNDCGQRFQSAIGMFAWERRSTERGGRVVVRRYYPTRADRDPLTRDDDSTTWCAGAYDGAVEWRGLGENDYSKSRTLPNGIEVFGNLIGTYSFEIVSDSGTPP
jgi:hypothetical protein